MTRTTVFLKEVQEVLEDNILHFWSQKLQDRAGGFYGQMDGKGDIVRDADKGVILNARIIWAFSAAYKKLGKTEYLVAATRAKDYFLEHFCDHRNGGVYWSVDCRGVRKDTKKQLYAQAFGIYALSEFYSAFGDDETLKNARNLYQVIEKHFSDEEFGGYTEALSRDFSPLEDMSLSAHDINADKTMNSHLHLLEAYANLYKVWPDKGLRSKVEALLDILIGKIMDRETGHLGLYFKRDWTPVPQGCSYGHDIETCWLSMEAAFALHDVDIIGKVRGAAIKMGRAGMEGLQGDGSLIYELRGDGSVDDSRQWWVQAESVVGNLWMWKYLGDPDGADRAIAAWDYIKTHLVDRKGGEWFWACSADGTPDLDSDKAGFWKCPYHNTRMCLEVLKEI